MAHYIKLITLLLIAILFVSCSSTTSDKSTVSSNDPKSINETSSATYKKTANLVRKGNCSELEALNSIDSKWSKLENNESAILLLKGYCAFYNEGNLKSGEDYFMRVALGTTSNKSAASEQLSIMREHVCDYEGALKWSSTASESNPAYIVDSSLAQTASIYYFKGEQNASRQKAKAYLDKYPLNFYKTTSSLPENISFDLEYAEKVHKELRGRMWLLLLSIGDKVNIPQEEISNIKEIVLLETPPSFNIQVGEGFKNSEAGLFYNISLLHAYAASLSSFETLQLDENTNKILVERINNILNKISNCTGECAETARMVSKYAKDVLLAYNSKFDKDKDGIPDAQDKCPEEPEVYNGVDDSDGCPDTAKVAITKGQITITEKILFKSGSALLLPQSKLLLDKIAELLITYPQIRKVSVEGHTDSRGNPTKNLQLSKDRALAVVQYLVQKGVSSARLVAVGHGSSKPLVQGNNQAAWDANRRVEFIILESDPITAPVK